MKNLSNLPTGLSIKSEFQLSYRLWFSRFTCRNPQTSIFHFCTKEQFFDEALVVLVSTTRLELYHSCSRCVRANTFCYADTLKGLQFYVHFGSFCPQGWDEIWWPIASGVKSSRWPLANLIHLKSPNNSLKNFVKSPTTSRALTFA